MTLKAALRDGAQDLIGAGAGLWPLSILTRRYFGQRIPIIFYHAVWRSGDPRLKLFGGVETGSFERDLARLARMFDFAPLDEVLSAPAARGKSKVAITFDDGFDLIAGGAIDVLRGFGVRATVFVNDDSWRYKRLLWQHAFGVISAMRGEATFLRAFNEIQRQQRLGARIEAFAQFIDATKAWPVGAFETAADEIWASCEMPPMAEFLSQHRPYLDHAGLAHWRRLGHDVGFHGKSHLWSKALGVAEIVEQYEAPARALKDLFGLDRIAFSYPFGDRLPPEQERALAATGVFSCLLGTDRLSRRGESPFAVDRVEADFGLVRHFFGRMLLRSLRRQDATPV
jgi:peptidoglycan/xylan/chitin deacetylase (PgdA/CDA1 family)